MKSEEALGLIEGLSHEPRFKITAREHHLRSDSGFVRAMTAYNIYRALKAEREHPPTGRFVTVDGVRLYYLERGAGPPVVLHRQLIEFH